jgi:CheY-like chemotaxis protein/HPt (histidine-containing phosphotransfer) domain-containing protein
MPVNSPAEVKLMLDALRKEFLNDLHGRIDDIEQLVLALPVHDRYEELYRHIHSLKGSGGTHGLELLSFACHQIEEEMNRLKAAGELAEEVGIRLLLDYIDVLRSINTMALQTSPDEKPIRDALQALRGASTGDRREILLVEPAGSIADMICESLAELPVKVTTENSGLQALELLLYRNYDLIVSALETRSLNGQALIAAAKSMRRYRCGLPCVLLTSNPLTPGSGVLAPDYVVVRNMQFGNQLQHIVMDELLV